jgi:lipoprotein-anchoring transpeptidase ErfK/SrfK
MRYASVVVSAAAAILLASCANQQDGSVAARQAAYNAYDRPAKLPNNPANVRVKVSLSTGITYVMEGDRPLLVMPVGVGKAATPTPTGNFRIYGKNHTRRANTHGFAIQGDQIRRTYLRDRRAGERFVGTPMPYWSEFKVAYGFHTGWIRPYPHTNGCIRMHHNIAPKFFRIVGNGTPVNIAQTQPEDATLGREIMANRPSAEGLVDHPLDYYLTNRYFTDHKEPKFE